eukprot:TRINITY_DN8964_c1_g1_i2.p2 TRINITY_DN8964_c1_g1~~TRINITY_DN8964_c1_g1_i2.p2  ORF type:complete len:311 (+),score=47.84 TRINITY_DN8964_c1_g1_i2:233-1165(+)
MPPAGGRGRGGHAGAQPPDPEEVDTPTSVKRRPGMRESSFSTANAVSTNTRPAALGSSSRRPTAPQIPGLVSHSSPAVSLLHQHQQQQQQQQGSVSADGTGTSGGQPSGFGEFRAASWSQSCSASLSHSASVSAGQLSAPTRGETATPISAAGAAPGAAHGAPAADAPLNRRQSDRSSLLPGRFCSGSTSLMASTMTRDGVSRGGVSSPLLAPTSSPAWTATNSPKAGRTASGAPLGYRRDSLDDPHFLPPAHVHPDMVAAAMQQAERSPEQGALAPQEAPAAPAAQAPQPQPPPPPRPCAPSGTDPAAS